MIKNASGFEIYLNCANPEICARLMKDFPIDGITSNPQMIATQNDGRTDLKSIIKELRAACGPDKLLFLQTPSNDFDDIMKDARELREAGGPNTIIKIPTCKDGIKSIETLTSMGIPTLGTQVLSTMQGILALKAGAKYIAPFYAPMEFGGVNGKIVYESLVKYKEISGCEGQIMGCAPRNMEEEAWMFTTGISVVTLDPCDFEDPFKAEVFMHLNNEVQNDWDSVFGAGARIHELLKNS